MAKPPGRPKGSGYPEDEPILREMVRAIRSKEVAGPHAAARKFADRVPGPTPTARISRLYDKVRERRAELESEIEAEEAQQEEDESDEISEKEMETLIRIGLDLSTDRSLEAKLSRLYAIFRPAAEAAFLKEVLIELLRAEGLELSSRLTEKLNISLYYFRSYQGDFLSKADRERVRKALKSKRLQAASVTGSPAKDEEKPPDSGD